MSNFNIATGFELYQQIGHLKEDKSELERNIAKQEKSLKIAELGTTLLYFAACMTLYLYEPWGFVKAVTANINEFLAIGLYAFIVLIVSRLLASSKSRTYDEATLIISRGKKLSTPFLLGRVTPFVIIALLFEAFNISAQQDIINRTNVSMNQDVQKILHAPPVLEPTQYLDGQIAAQEQKLTQCQKRHLQGAEKYCDGDIRNLASLTKRRDAIDARNTGVKVGQTENKIDGYRKAVEDFAKPAFKAVAELLGISIAAATYLVVLGASAAIEYSHYNLINSTGAIKWDHFNILNKLKNAEVEYVSVTGKAYRKGDFADLHEGKHDIQRNTNPLVTSWADAQQYQGTNPNLALAKSQSPAPIGFMDRDENGNVVRVTKAKNIIKNAELATGLDTGTPLGIPSAQPLGIPSAQPLGIPSAQPLGIPSAQPSSKQAVPVMEKNLKAFADELYVQWLKDVQKGVADLGRQSTTNYIWANGKTENGKKVATVQEAKRIWMEWCEKGCRDGVLMTNPDYQPNSTKPKYKLISR